MRGVECVSGVVRGGVCEWCGGGEGVECVSGVGWSV